MNIAEEREFRLPVGIHKVAVDHSGKWLAAGWHDFLRAPRVSLIYGGAFAAISLGLSWGLIAAGLGSLVLPLAGGFVMLAPILVVGLYDVSRRLELGESISLADVFAAFGANIGQLAAMGVVLLILWFMWVEIAIFLFAIFFNQAPPPLNVFVEEVLFSVQGAPLLIVGTLVGAAFSLLIFALTAISVPMLFDRPVDVVTAISTSLLAVRANWQTMFGWAAMIGVITVCAIATFFIGLAVALPVLAYASWHAYRDVISPEAPPPPETFGVGEGI